jgi:hypothetical protein
LEVFAEATIIRFTQNDTSQERFPNNQTERISQWMTRRKINARTPVAVAWWGMTANIAAHTAKR